jgi:beta-lactam-binding protein with PASTA domain
LQPEIEYAFMIKQLTRKPLWMNILFGLILVLALLFIFIASLDWITNHGVARTVPSVTGKTFEQVSADLEARGFELVVQDSVYYDSVKPGIVVKQFPEPDAVVKVNRTVYITVNRTVPPDVEMPNLIGYTYRNAEMVLKNMGLRVGDTTFRPDFAKNSVLEQAFNGQPIKPGAKIRMGSAISLVIGSGVGANDMPVPKLVGLTYEEARILLQAQGLILVPVSIDPLVRDTAAAFVSRQNPVPKSEDGFQLRIRPGQMVDVWLTKDRPVTDSTQTAPKPDPNDGQEEE